MQDGCVLQNVHQRTSDFEALQLEALQPFHTHLQVECKVKGTVKAMSRSAFEIYCGHGGKNARRSPIWESTMPHIRIYHACLMPVLLLQEHSTGKD